MDNKFHIVCPDCHLSLDYVDGKDLDNKLKELIVRDVDKEYGNEEPLIVCKFCISEFYDSAAVIVTDEEMNRHQLECPMCAAT